MTRSRRDVLKGIPAAVFLPGAAGNINLGPIWSAPRPSVRWWSPSEHFAAGQDFDEWLCEHAGIALERNKDVDLQWEGPHDVRPRIYVDDNVHHLCGCAAIHFDWFNEHRDRKQDKGFVCPFVGRSSNFLVSWFTPCRDYNEWTRYFHACADWAIENWRPVGFFSCLDLRVAPFWFDAEGRFSKEAKYLGT